MNKLELEVAKMSLKAGKEAFVLRHTLDLAEHAYAIELLFSLVGDILESSKGKEDTLSPDQEIAEQRLGAEHELEWILDSFPHNVEWNQLEDPHDTEGLPRYIEEAILKRLEEFRNGKKVFDD